MTCGCEHARRPPRAAARGTPHARPPEGRRSSPGLTHSHSGQHGGGGHVDITWLPALEGTLVLPTPQTATPASRPPGWEPPRPGGPSSSETLLRGPLSPPVSCPVGVTNRTLTCLGLCTSRTTGHNPQSGARVGSRDVITAASGSPRFSEEAQSQAAGVPQGREACRSSETPASESRVAAGALRKVAVEQPCPFCAAAKPAAARRLPGSRGAEPPGLVTRAPRHVLAPHTGHTQQEAEGHLPIKSCSKDLKI